MTEKGKRMNSVEFKQKTLDILRDESAEPEDWWYLSFADDTFREAVIVRAKGLLHAVTAANMLGINPGGEVVGAPMTGFTELPAEEFRNRLLTREDVLAIWPDAKSAREWDEEESKCNPTPST